MSKYSLNIAIKYGETLREFSNKSEAENYFISYKDNLLNRLKAISIQTSAFFLDYTIGQVGLTQEEFESMIKSVIKYKGFYIDKTKNGYRISKQSNTSIHTHLRNLSPSYKMIDNIVEKRIPKRCNLYYIQSHIRLADDDRYKRNLHDYYNVKVNKGKKLFYYNPSKKRF